MIKYASHEKIKRAQQVKHVLGRIHESRSLVQILIPKSGEVYNSIILDVDDHAETILLDSLNPAEGNTKLIDKGVFYVKARLNGVDVTFQTHIENFDSDTDFTYYRAKMPTQINYHQRRSVYRLSLSKAFAPKVIFLSPEKYRMEGIADNISLGGLRALFKQPKMCYWQEGQRIPNCTVQLTPNTHIISAVEIRNSHYNKSEKTLQIGVRFTHLTKLQESSIAKYVTASERELRRKGLG